MFNPVGYEFYTFEVFMLVKMKLKDPLGNLLSYLFNYDYCILILALEDEGIPCLPYVINCSIDYCCVHLSDPSVSCLLLKRLKTLVQPCCLKLHIPILKCSPPKFPLPFGK